MEKIFSENFHQNKSNERSIAYVDEFKDFIHKNPNVIKKVHQLLNNAVKDSAENDGIEITSIDDTNSSIKPTFPSFKVQKGEDIFFVKANDRKSNRLGGKGFDEFIDTKKAKEILNEIPWVEVVNSQLGYKDDRYTYYISKWNNLFSKSLLDYMEKLEEQIKNNPNSSQDQKLELVDIESKIKFLKDKLGEDYYDIFPHNMAYDPNTKKIFMFDLNRWPNLNK